MTTSVKVETIIHRSAEIIYNAISQPDKICNYFVSYADQPLTEGKPVRWEFDDAGVQLSILVRKLVVNKLIQFSWGPTEKETLVDITIESLGENSSKITVRESEWKLNEDGVSRALQQTEGWTDFLCCLKAYLLFNVNLRRSIDLQQN